MLAVTEKKKQTQSQHVTCWNETTASNHSCIGYTSVICIQLERLIVPFKTGPTKRVHLQCVKLRNIRRRIVRPRKL